MTTMNRTEAVGPPTFEGWAIVEIMGHRRHYGMVREVDVFGGKMCRVDVPETPPVERERTRWVPTGDGDGHVEHLKETVPAKPAQTYLYGTAAIFGITPCTEEVVQKALEREQMDRVLPVARAALPEAADDESVIDAGYDEDPA